MISSELHQLQCHFWCQPAFSACLQRYRCILDRTIWCCQTSLFGRWFLPAVQHRFDSAMCHSRHNTVPPLFWSCIHNKAGHHHPGYLSYLFVAVFSGRFPPGRSGRAFFGVCLASFTRRSGAICFTTGLQHVARCVDIRVYLFGFCCRRQLFQQLIHIGLPVYEGRDLKGLLTFGRCRKYWSNVNKLRVDNGGGMAAKASLVTKAVPAACDAVSQLAHLKPLGAVCKCFYLAVWSSWIVDSASN